MKEKVGRKNGGSVMLMISSRGQPVALVPAESIEQAQKRALDLLRSGQGHEMGLLTNEAQVTLFSPALVADGETLAYLPTHEGSSRGIHGRTSAAPGSVH